MQHNDHHLRLAKVLQVAGPCRSHRQHEVDKICQSEERLALGSRAEAAQDRLLEFVESCKRMPKAAVAADDRVDQGSFWRKRRRPL